MEMRYLRDIALTLALAGCGGEADIETQPAALCAWEEPLEGECARFTGPAGSLSLEGRSCEPVSCLLVPFGRNDGTLQQVQVASEDGVDMETGACSELACD